MSRNQPKHSQPGSVTLIEAMSTEIEELRAANAELVTKVADLSEELAAVVPITLREWDYGAGPSGGFVEREYPFGPIKRFVEWFRNTTQWKESPEMAYHQWLRFERDMTDERNDAARLAAKVAA